MTDADTIVDEIKKLMGKERTVKIEVEKGMMMKIPWAIDDPNPLWRDEHYARQTRWGGIIASPSFVEYLRIGARNLNRTTTPFASPGSVRGGPPGVVGGEEVEFFQPVRPGDVITGSRKLIDAKKRRSKSLNKDIVIQTSESKFTNQFGELVATMRATRMVIF